MCLWFRCCPLEGINAVISAGITPSPQLGCGSRPSPYDGLSAWDFADPADAPVLLRSCNLRLYNWMPSMMNIVYGTLTSCLNVTKAKGFCFPVSLSLGMFSLSIGPAWNDYVKWNLSKDTDNYFMNYSQNCRNYTTSPDYLIQQWSLGLCLCREFSGDSGCVRIAGKTMKGILGLCYKYVFLYDWDTSGIIESGHVFMDYIQWKVIDLIKWTEMDVWLFSLHPYALHYLQDQAAIVVLSHMIRLNFGTCLFDTYEQIRWFLMGNSNERLHWSGFIEAKIQ